MSTEATVARIPFCDICTQRKAANPDVEVHFAAYDAKTSFGQWANLCHDHFDEYGIGLGTGLGQRLVLSTAERVPVDIRAELSAAIDRNATLGELEDIVGDGDIIDYL